MEDENIEWPCKSKREMWLSISNSILVAQEKHPTLKYV